MLTFAAAIAAEDTTLLTSPKACLLVAARVAYEIPSAKFALLPLFPAVKKVFPGSAVLEGREFSSIGPLTLLAERFMLAAAAKPRRFCRLIRKVGKTYFLLNCCCC
jgi:hypothetical protein